MSLPSPMKSPLSAGLAALKQKDYQTAINQLQLVVHSQSDSKASLQAQVGLVMAYARTGEVAQAIALCEHLMASDHLQLKDWAIRALEHLTKQEKSVSVEPETNVTGFIPFAHSSTTTSPPEFPKPELEVHPDPVPISPSQGLMNLVDNVATNQVLPLPISSPTSTPGQTEDYYLGDNEGKTTDVILPQEENSHQETRTEPFRLYWQQAERAKVWQPLHKPNLIPSRLLAIGTFMTLFLVLREMLKYLMGLINQTLDKLPFVEPIQILYQDPTVFLLGILLVLVAASPWLLDWLLSEFYGQQHLSKETLHNYSREAVRVLQRRHKYQPKLWILPLTAPVALTYGNLPRQARIVVSQGLLDQLDEDEIAAIYGLCLGQIGRWDFPVMSLLLLVTVPIYRLYYQGSEWGNRISQTFYRRPVIVLTSLVYGIWCMLIGTALLNSRSRIYDSDRIAAEMTGNPNGVIRALLKMMMGIASDIQKQQHTSWQLESLNLFIPVSYQQSISSGSFAQHTAWESLFLWENVHPYRQWFTINNSHPLMGDRLQSLCKIARHWHLETELHLTSQKSLPMLLGTFLLQIAPWLGIFLGLAFAGVMWLMWQIVFALKLINLKWIYEDWSFVTGCLLIGFSIGIILRINYFFPDIRTATVQTDAQLLKVLTNPSIQPVDSISVSLVGKLLGRSGINNCLAQDLMLQTSSGLVKLHHIAGLRQSISPQDWVGRQINVTGWFRRGATPWIDIQTLQTQSGKTINSPHPILVYYFSNYSSGLGCIHLAKGVIV